MKRFNLPMAIGEDARKARVCTNILNILFILTLFYLPAQLNAQCQLTCNDNVQISLDDNCSGVTPDMLLEGDNPTSTFTILLPDGTEFNALSANEAFTGSGSDPADWSAYVGKNIGYEIVANDCGGTCWGSMKLESNIVPVFTSPHQTNNYCPGDDPASVLVTAITGKITNDSKDDVNLDPEWYGVGEQSGWYADILDFTIPFELFQECPTGSGSIVIVEDFQKGLKGYDEEVEWIDVDPAYIFLGSDGRPLAVQPSSNNLGAGTYKLLIYADDNDGLGNYTVSVNFNRTSCLAIAEPLTTIYCDQQYPDDWVHYYGKNGILAALDTIGCGLDYEPIEPHVEVCGNICDPDGELNIVTYYIQVNLHGKSSYREILRQGFIRKQQLPVVCMPLDYVYLECDGDGSVEGVFEARKAYYLEEGYDDQFSTMKAYADSYPHVCDGPFIDYTANIEVLGHVIDTIGTETRIVWVDLDEDGEQDLNEWVEKTFIKKEIRETTVIKTIICKDVVDVDGPDGGPDGIDDNDPDCEAIHSIIPFSEKYCGYVAYNVDRVVDECGGGKKIARSWRLLNWCTSDIIYLNNFEQVIFVTDRVEPEMEFYQPVVEANVDPWTCEISLDLPRPKMSDNCTAEEDLVITYRTSLGYITGDTFKSVPTQIGQYASVTYIVTDECGNSVSADLIVKVVDKTPPVAVCKDVLAVSITPDMDGGVAKIPVSSFDVGSHDGTCGSIVKRKVIRLEDYVRDIDYAFDSMSVAGLPVSCSPETKLLTLIEKDKFGNIIGKEENLATVWSDYVKFCCEDVGKEDLLVILRVWDQSGNFNDCMVRVEVQDKLSLFTCPPNVAIPCYTYSTDSLYGYPTATLTCDEMDISYIDDDTDINSCGQGKIIRIWSGIEPSGKRNVCTQIIQLTDEGSFYPESIRWPVHFDGEVAEGIRLEPNDKDSCVQLSGNYIVAHGPKFECTDAAECKPEFETTGCGLIGISMREDTVYQADNACMKIIRRWSVIDWCTWAPNDDPNDMDINDLDDENDTSNDQFELAEDWCLSAGCIKDNEYSTYYRYKRTADGAIVDRDGFYTYDQILIFEDNVAPTFSGFLRDTIQPGNDSNCLANLALVNVASDQGFCQSEVLFWFVTLYDADGDRVGSSQTGEGNAFGFTMTDIPLGEYVIDWQVKDGCGNEASEETKVTLMDMKAPTPVCIQDLSTAVMTNNGSVTIWAEDYDPERKSFDACNEEIIYSFSGDSIVPSATFACADLGGETSKEFEMKLWVHDPDGNADYCFVTLVVQGADACATGGGLFARVEGIIATEAGEMVELAEVSINSTRPGYPKEFMTEDNGKYAFPDNPMSFQYTISADRNDNYMNGVSTLDLVLMQNHILGTKLFTSPYKVIAADINNDTRVSTLDLVQLRKLILGEYAELPGNSSWRFVSAHQEFSNSSRPWPLTEYLDINYLENDMMQEDFIGVKIGDVNGNVQANSLQQAEVRSNNILELIVADRNVEVGEVITIDFSADNFEEIYGFQFTLQHDGLQLYDFDGDAIEFNDDNIFNHGNVSAISWNDIEGVSTEENLMSISFVAMESGQLSDMIAVSDRIATAESYAGASLELQGLSITVENENLVSSEFMLYQNAPNPFSRATDIKFNLPKAGKASLIVFDVSGKLVHSHSGQFEAGINQISLTSDLVESSGLYYYRLESGTHTATKKMIVLD